MLNIITRDVYFPNYVPERIVKALRKAFMKRKEERRGSVSEFVIALGLKRGILTQSTKSVKTILTY